VPKKLSTKPAKRTAKRPLLPDPSGDAPLAELSRDALSVFLYVAITPEESLALVKELGLQIPGFRQEALGDVQRCDALADEIRYRPELRERPLALLRKAFGGPPLAGAPIDAAVARDLLAVGDSEHGLALALWRVLCDPAPAVRAEATPLLEQLAAELYGPAPAEGAPEPAKPRPEEELEALRRKLEAAQAELVREQARVEQGRRKAEEREAKLQDWLKSARAREAQAVDEAARARTAQEAAAAERQRLEADLKTARGAADAVEAQRARAAWRDAEARAAALEARLERSRARGEELAREAEALRGAAAPAAPAGPDATEESEDAAAQASWLFPIYTREFYDSLEGWDRRIQRAAFKQAHLLAQDHRHPSLRALPLEGLPGYYRVRVATDVRLLYRRGERQNAVEILSLIDREDLDRYVRQAKTRQG
jgi:mRNA-degrading endonuclease RelE of RelBE toxin-antitoxin system